VDYCNESAFVGPDSNDYPKNAPTTARPNSNPPSGGPPGSDLAWLTTQTLDAWNAEVGILNCAYRVQSVHSEDLAASLATAINQWQIEQWLEKEPRLRASLVIPSQNPSLAAEEIDRFGAHPGFVQAVLPVRSLIPYGNRHYDPIYAAAVRQGLVVGIQYGGSPGNPPFPSGWPSTFVEEYAGMAQVFQSQVISLVIEGVFDRFPDLRITLIEGGFTWLPSLMWRIDKEWKGLRHNTPWVKRLPSEYMRDHIRLTTQPVDMPPNAEMLDSFIEQIDSDEVLMFATDYPHRHDVEDAEWVMRLDAVLSRKILSENARAWYRL
jgi:predicted TIM-barrel fold metal-dependent hydrolase